MKHSFHSARLKRFMRKPLVSLCTAGTILFFYPLHSFSAPTDGLVVKGSAAISQSGLSTIIDQGSARAVIDWRGFDISANERVQFNQVSSSAIALNRITGGNPTSILGQLAANGRVFISNPNGVVFGAGSQVDVAGLLATTLSVNADDFMAGKNAFTQASGLSPSFVVNQGEIRIADNGFCFLVAPGVQNSGTIIGQLGKVVMASGDALTLDFNGDGLVTYTVSGKVLESILGPDGKPFDATVSNTGTITAPGGNVVLVGNGAKDVFSSVVNNSGLIEATSLVAKGGEVALLGGEEGIVQNTGSIDVSAAEAGARAGHVAISGQFAGNFGAIAAKGTTDSNGGVVELTSTTHTLLGSGSLIEVSGQDNSSAGTVLIRSDNHATFGGQVVARGGDNGGDGGFVDVSSLGQVDLWGTVNALAPAGKIGTLLIDPQYLVVATGGGGYANNTFSSNSGGITTIAPANINSQTSTVILQAMADITLSNDITMAGTAGAGLTIQAGRSVIVNASVYTSGNNGAVSITANDHTSGATLTPTSRIDASAGNITMASGTTISTGSGNITLTVDPSVTSPFTPGGITVANLTTTGDVTLTAAGGDIATVGTSLISGATVSLEIKSALDASKTSDMASYVQHNIGSSGAHIKTSATTLSATTEYGAIYIDETDAVTINNLTAKYKGATAQANLTSGDVTAKAVDGSSASSGLDVSVTAGGNITLGSVSTPHTLLITSTAQVLDGNGGVNNIVAKSLTLSGTAIGSPAAGNTPPDAIEIQSPTITSVTASSGDIYLALGSKSTLAFITASGDIGISNAVSDLTLGLITAGGGDAVITSDAGKLFDTAGDISATTVRLAGRDGIGVNGTPITTEAATLITGTTALNAGIYVTNTSPINSVTAVTKDGEVSILGPGSSTILTFVDSSNILSATASTKIYFANTQEGIEFGNINAGTGEVALTASGAITAGSGSLTAGAAVLQATSLGTSVSPLQIPVTTLTATATAGGVYVNDIVTGPLTLTASANGTGNDVTVTTGGGLILKSVTAPGAVKLTAVGAMTDGNGAASTASNITAAAATLSAANFGASVTDKIDTAVTTLGAIATNGGIYLTNTKAMTFTALATGGDINLYNIGNLALKSVGASGHAVTLTATGAITDGNGSSATSTNIGAATANLTASGIGTSAADRLDTAVGTLNATTSANGIYLTNTGALVLTATANGNGADIDINNGGGQITVGLVTAAGDAVRLKTTTSINAAATNKITAKALTLDAGSSVSPDLVLSVSQVSGNSTTPLTLTNDQPLALTASAISGGGTFTAPSITILDLVGPPSDDPVQVAVVNGTPDTATSANSLTLKTTTGHIVFLDTTDTISLTSGSIDIDAGANSGDSGAVAIIGNLKTAGGAITVKADSHISIGELNSGLTGGLVTVASRNGMIIDGNGTADNIIAGSASLSALTPSEYNAKIHTDQSISDASTAESKANTDTNTYNSTKANAGTYSTKLTDANTAKDEATTDVASKQSAFDSSDETASEAELAAQILSDIAAALGIVADTAELVSSSAQIIPLVGDGGASVAYTALKWVATAANLGALISGETAGALRDIANGDEADLIYAQNVLDNKVSTADKAQLDSNVWAETLSTYNKIMQQSLVTSAAAQLVKAQALTADKHIDTTVYDAGGYAHKSS